MKKLFTKSLIIITLLFNSSIFSQEVKNDEVINKSTSITSFDARPKNLVGSEYIIKEFLPAKLIDNDEIFSIRYNAYQDEMEVRKNEKEYSLPKDFNNTITFINSKKEYAVFEYIEGETSKKGFFVVIFKGTKISLTLKEKIKLLDEVHPNTGYEKYKPPTLKREKDKFYLAYKNNTTAKLPSKKKDFFNLFSTNSKAVQAYVKENKLGIKNQEDLIDIFQFYSSLN